jgi:hypothetical protein
LDEEEKGWKISGKVSLADSELDRVDVGKKAYVR